MNIAIFDRIGDYNPQLYRELKGRLRPRTILTTVIISGSLQVFILFSHSYDFDGVLEIQWKTIFYDLNWFLFVTAIAIGVYLLSRDICREKARGTLDFIRLSPRSSESILLGKLLGVPILLYSVIALTIPLHLIAAILSLGDLSVAERLFSFGRFYCVGIALCGIFYNLALLRGLLQNPPQGFNFLPATNSAISLLLSPIAFVWVLPFFPEIYSAFDTKSWHWFYLPESFAYPWLLAILLALNLLFWQMANRRLRNPHLTLISKVQSYWILGSLEIGLLGLALPEISKEGSRALIGWRFFGFAFTPIYLLLVTIGLSLPALPHKIEKESSPERTKGMRARLQEIFLEDNRSVSGAIILNVLVICGFWVGVIACVFKVFLIG